MKQIPLSLAPLAVLLLTSGTPAAEPKPANLPPAKTFEVEVVKDLAYYDGTDADPVKHKLDLYLPKGQKDFSVLFFVHGGAWTIGDRTWYVSFGRYFASRGLGMVLPSYRLSPKVKHPAHIEDVARAFAWTQRHIGKYGGDPKRLSICGHSAGAHLVALLATDECYLRAEKLSFADIRCVVPLSGVYRIVPPFFNSTFGQDKDVCKDASPVEHVGDKHPPFLIVYADKDLPFCDKMSEELYQALQKHKCEASLLKIKDRDHLSILMRMSNDGDPATQALLDFLAKHADLKLPPREAKKEDKP